jgi:hypothetical protein
VKPGTGERNTYAREVRVEKRLVCLFVPSMTYILVDYRAKTMRRRAMAQAGDARSRSHQAVSVEVYPLRVDGAFWYTGFAESHAARRFVGTVLAHRVDCSPMRGTS